MNANHHFEIGKDHIVCEDGQIMWPIQWDNEIGNLEVHKDAKKELGIID